MPATSIPKQQRAVQLIGPGQLQINENKAVPEPGPDQVLGRVEVVGLCFSDLKLLNQFSAHARKSAVADGIAPDLLREMPNYVPGDKPAVPGHEAVLRLAKVGANVKGHKAGDRCLVQTDYRWLPTANSNSAFGYNFEGALQEYVLLDQRVFTSPAANPCSFRSPRIFPPPPLPWWNRGPAWKMPTSKSSGKRSKTAAACSSSAKRWWTKTASGACRASRKPPPSASPTKWPNWTTPLLTT